MDLERLETEARTVAAKHVANMLQRPDQLEKVEQYKKQVSRKKTSVEAMLKTAMQSQLDGVRSGLNQLQVALEDVRSIEKNLKEVNEALEQLPSLCSKLKDVREENARYSQYATAMENLKHIFNLRENVQKTKEWIQKGDLLHAHQYLTELETSRNDMLFELYHLPSAIDQNMLKAYFVEVDQLSDMLGSLLWDKLSGTLDLVVLNPTLVVTVLRIVEREERADVIALQQQKQSGFLAPARPKKWREKAMQILKKDVENRIGNNKHSSQDDDKLWLVKHLELTRQKVLKDLHTVKFKCVVCFPPSWSIVEMYVRMYHESLGKHLQKIIRESLRGSNFITLLSWVMNTYPGPELLQSPTLDIDASYLQPLLDNSQVEELVTIYLQNMEKNYSEWIKNTLAKEVQDWWANTAPETDSQGFFHTGTPIIIFQMVDQNLHAAQKISQEVMHRGLLTGMDMIAQYGKLYKDAIVEFKKKHFEDRSQVPYFTHYMIAITNNCLHFMELAQQLKQRYWKPGVHDNEVGKKYEVLMSTFQNLRNDVGGFLLEEAFLDLEPHFQSLITRPWLTSRAPMDTICVTLEDYFQDYGHLRLKNLEHIISEAQNLVARKYITAMLQKKMSFKGQEERQEASRKISQEADQVKSFFRRIARTVATMDSPFDSIQALGEVLAVEDPEFLTLELHGLVKKYPDLTQDHLVCLLRLRGDIGKLDVWQRAAQIIPDKQPKKSGPVPKSIFSQIHVSASFFGAAM